MTSEFLYTTIAEKIRKDQRGGKFNISTFNRLVQIADKRILMAFMSRSEEDIEITSHAGFLKVFDYPIALTNGVGSLPSNFFKPIGDPWCYDITEDDPSANIRWLDIVTSQEHTYREQNYLTKSTTDYPTCVIGGQDGLLNLAIRAYPSTINMVYMNYFRSSVAPYLDYYINKTTLQPTYLAAGIGSFIVPVGCQYRDGTDEGGAATSLTVDPEWDLHELPWFVAYILSEIGVAIPDDILIRIGKSESAEIQNKQIW
jgi:hypothetical protein